MATDAIGLLGKGATLAYNHGMKPEPVIVDVSDIEADAATIARARADAAAGRSVPHELVAAWLRTWGTADEKPMPREWLE